jgi:hypothetical protein
MRKILNKIQLISRWCVLTCLLAGLFFSSGEGIQLFPFPVAPDQTERKNVSDKKDKVYSFSVLNSSGHAGVTYSKIQKNLKFLDFAQFFRGNPPPSKMRLFEIGPQSSRPVFYNSSVLVRTPSDRAPPAV